MSQYNAFVSNGTCYYAENSIAQGFIPCGNDALGHKACCQAGDMCLSSNACYNGRFGVTYLAGCSDEAYADGSCPQKAPWSGDPWVGLVYCNGTSNQWVACDQPRKPSTLESPVACWCPETSRTVQFTDSSVLKNVVSLPTATGASVIWQPGFVPSPVVPSTTLETSTTSTTATAGTTSVPPITASTPTQTVPPAATPDPASGKSTTGTKIGIGVGVAVGCTFLLAFVALIFFLRRRQLRRRHASDIQDMSNEKDGQSEQVSSTATGGTPITPVTPTLSELEPRRARPWSMRSELEGSQGHSELDSAVAIQSQPTGETMASSRPADRLTPVAELPA